MGNEWLWTPKPSFTAEWRALPRKDEHLVFEKIKLLEQDYIAQIMEYMYPKPLAQILQQPDYLLDDLDDLLRYKEGELLGFLLRLSPEQERFVSWAIKATGPTQVKGGPGTGKSTVALYRVRSLIEKLRKMGQSEPCILFTTYTNALVNSSSN